LASRPPSSCAKELEVLALALAGLGAVAIGIALSRRHGQSF
jgi:hypothetical protein